MNERHALTPDRVRALDEETSSAYGVPGRCLMEVAGFGAFEFLLRSMILGRAPRPTLVVAGRGNNAGDGFVLARFLASQGFPVFVVAIDDPARLPEGDARANAGILPRYGVRIEWPASDHLADGIGGAGIVVDALLGTGVRGPVSPPFAEAIDAINDSGVPVLALDLPSGLCGETGAVLGAAVRATWTVTFGALKTGLVRGRGPELAGEIHVVPLPFPPGWDRSAGGTPA